ncbi:MAG: 16S rRNA (guanine(966)-N(2))-methyltransferase RsmD [Desulfuromusa sp.]|jgi:16S rRNA (guanine(966)-N(2))-methyltransferase RsmD|nr:16S rRNA (guanine(966)-N(2))-methyltransferase RsmD [Desulfuromusa sp.]
MRIISGSARGRQLTEFSGKDIRPTPDRVREAIFSILTSKLGSFNGLNVLELFAGSGAQSLEALSRGASSAIMVDSGQTASEVMAENIKRCRFESRVRVMKQDVFTALPQLTVVAPFDLILLDPPYNQNLLAVTVEKIEHLNLLAENGIICAESSSKETLSAFESFKLINERTYGSTRIHLLCL